MGPNRWKVITPSQFTWEQEAFDFLRARLPDTDPYLAWQGFDFIADNGSIYEVDLLVLTPTGLYLVEVKSRPGVLGGDATTWTWKHEGRVTSTENPFLLANRKAKKLAALLKKQKAVQETGLPFLDALIFCSAQGLQVELQGEARSRVCTRDREAAADRPARPGIVEALVNRVAPGLDPSIRRRIDSPMARAVARAVEQAGIRQGERFRRIGDFKLTALLMEGPGYQDWEGVHVSLPDNFKRIRRYTLTNAAGDEDRQTLLRAARREYQILEGLNHPGILSARQFTENEFGPAIVFEHHPKAIRLDHFLTQYAARLGIDARLSILRQVAEAIRHAHDKHIFHRGLSPQSVLVVDPAASQPQVKVFNWQTGVRELGTSSGGSAGSAGSGGAGGSGGSGGGRGVTGTVHIEQLIDDSATVYMAPEAMSDRSASGEQLDVFSLGALAYHLFTGKAPATSFAELGQQLKKTQGLQVSAVLDGATPHLQDLVLYATCPDVTMRTGTAADFLSDLEKLEDELTTPASPEGPADQRPRNPLEAQVGDRLDRGFTVKSQLGTGSSARVLLVEKDGQVSVLKVARGVDFNARLRDEGEVLKKLRHQSIVELYEVFEIDGLVCLHMQKVGPPTLARRLREEGPLQLDLLQRFGDDLLQAVTWLEHQGIPHRDIKPENIGIMEMPPVREKHLVLFDFSLSRTPLEMIRAGTPPYLEPFLIDRKPVRWDLQAERYATAVTLYEMATRTHPRWGDGKTDAHMLTCEATIDSDLFDAGVREGLTAFFTRALRRDFTQRFDNCEDMLRAWRQVFLAVDKPTTASDTGEEPDWEAAVAQATLSTPVSVLGFSPRMLSTLDRLNVSTVEDLLKVPLGSLHHMRGVGNKTRRRVAEVVSRLRARFPGVQEKTAPPEPPEFPKAAQGEAAGSVVQRVDGVFKLVTGEDSSRRGANEVKTIRTFLGVEDLALPVRIEWPTQTDVAATLGISVSTLNRQLGEFRKRWQKTPAITALRHDIVEILDAHAGVMAADRLSMAVLAARGSSHGEPQRSTYASAVTRAAVETEAAMEKPRLLLRRAGRVVLTARSQELADFACRLGIAADRLAAADPLPSPQRVIEALRKIDPPAEVGFLTDERLVKLAASASQSVPGAAVNSRLEVYPREMPAGRALKLAMGTLLGVNELKIREIQDRVTSRYPEAQALPAPPELDKLLEEAGAALRWNPTKQAYLSTAAEVFGTQTVAPSSTRYTTAPGPVVVTPRVAEAREFEERLERCLRQGGFLALSVAPRYLLETARQLRRRFPAVDLKSFDELLIARLKAQVAARKVDWNLVTKTDATGPGGRDWPRLMTLVRAAAAEVQAELVASGNPILLMFPGLVARYDLVGVLEHLRDQAGRPGMVPGAWVLIPGDGQHDMPMIENKSVPVIGRSQWTRVPDPWRRNEHQNGNGGAPGSNPGGPGSSVTTDFRAPARGASPAANREAPGTHAVKSQIPNPKSPIPQ